MTVLESLYRAVVGIHVAAGVTCLATVVIPLVAAKGGRLHKRAGWVFVTAMALSSLTALMIAGAWMSIPLEVKPPTKSLTDAELADRVAAFREYGSFFAYIGAVAGVAVWQGVTAIRFKHTLGPWNGRIERAFAWGMILGGAALMLFGIVRTNPLLIGFGALGLFSGRSDLALYRAPVHPRGAWLFRHLQAMLGGATVALTAFTIQSVGRWLAGGGLSGLGALIWVVPIAIGMSASMWWTRRYRRRLAAGYTFS